MIRAKEMILQQLHTGTFLFQKFTDGLLDEEYFIAPPAGGNHTAWNLGHVACVEEAIVSGICSGQPKLTKVVHDLFASGGSCSVDAARYPSRAETDSLFSETRERTVYAVEELDDALWNDSAPPSFSRDLFPTRGAPSARISSGIWERLRFVERRYAMIVVCSSGTAFHIGVLVHRIVRSA